MNTLTDINTWNNWLEILLQFVWLAYLIHMFEYFEDPFQDCV